MSTSMAATVTPREPNVHALDSYEDGRAIRTEGQEIVPLPRQELKGGVRVFP
jgi:hypothetical protein